MAYREFSPHRALRPFVDRFWVSSDGAGAEPRRILPDGCIDLMVDLARGGYSVAVGTMTRAVLFQPRGAIRIVAVRFRPGGAVPFLRVSADELTDRMVEATEVGVRWLAPASLMGFADLAHAARALERVLLNRLHAIPSPDPLVAHAVSALFRPAPPTIEKLSGAIGWSRQHLGRTFRYHIGVTPKQLARVARVQRAVDELQRGSASDMPGLQLSLAEAAVRLGYFDQAHMARDFHDLAGVTPFAVRASRGSIFPIRSLLEGA
jgi:AraC-like DNA-binding protein